MKEAEVRIMGEDANPAEPDGRIGILPYGKSKLPRGVQPGGSGLPLARSKMEATAAILAGGLGTRLRPAVADRPKVLAPVNGRPYLTYLLDQLVEASFRQVVLLTGHGAHQVQQTLGQTYAGMRLAYSREPEPLGTAGAIRWALPRLAAPVVLLMNGDSFCEVDLPAFRRFHECRAADLSLVLTEAADTSRFGSVGVNPAGRLLRFAEKTPDAGAGWINAGMYFLDRNLIAEIPSGRPVSLEKDMMPAWINGRKHIFGYRSAGRFLDIGTPRSYAEAETFFTRSCKERRETKGSDPLVEGV